MRRLRDLLALGDVLWAGWLAVLRPVRGGLFLAGGAASVFLVAAALVSGREQGRRSGAILRMSLGVCAILIDAGLKQSGAALIGERISGPLVGGGG